MDNRYKVDSLYPSTTYSQADIIDYSTVITTEKLSGYTELRVCCADYDKALDLGVSSSDMNKSGFSIISAPNGKRLS